MAEQDEARPGDEAEEARGDAGEATRAEAGGDEAEARDDAAARVAEALGVDEEGEAKEAASEEAPAEEEVKNRAVRRRDEALQRRRKKKAADGKPGSRRDDLPKDRNARAKELLQRRREDAAMGRRAASDLGAGELVDDVLARMANGTTNWLKEHAGVVLLVALAAIVGGVGYAGYSFFQEKKAIAASRLLGEGLSAEEGRVMAEDKRSDEEKEADTSRIFKTNDERATATLNAYNQVVDKYPGTGPAILAKLGQAGVYLEKREWDHAIEAFSAVVGTPLAAADADVKGRAIEGIGLAREAKGDLDGALASFKELESIDRKTFKELARYHQGRVLFEKGDKDKAKEILKGLHDKLEVPTVEGPQSPYLREMVDEALRKIDPTLVPARPTLNGPKGGQMTPEELDALMKRAREAAQKKAAEHGP